MLWIGSERSEDDHRKDQIENDDKNIVEDVLPGSGDPPINTENTVSPDIGLTYDHPIEYPDDHS